MKGITEKRKRGMQNMDPIKYDLFIVQRNLGLFGNIVWTTVFVV